MRSDGSQLKLDPMTVSIDEMISLNEIMTTNPVTMKPDDPIAHAGELMREHRIRHVPVVERGGELVGLITQRDILASASTDDELETARDIMRTHIYTVAENSDMRGAALTMQKYKIGSLPVVDGKKLIGIVTDSDYVALAINLLEQLEFFEDEPEVGFEDLTDLESYAPEGEVVD